jgi:hypothetical protein
MLKFNFKIQSKSKLKRNSKKNNKGMALIEALPVLFMVILIFNFSLGFFGAIHSGILNSIGSYNYTMETFRFRSNLVYFRPGGGVANYAKSMNRVHGVTADGYKMEDSRKGKWPVTIRSVTVSGNGKLQGSTEVDNHSLANKSTSVWRAISSYTANSEDDAPKTPEIWIKTVYGICLNAECIKVN